jgi:imidazole glycerol phosphate synthase subunit HisF
VKQISENVSIPVITASGTGKVEHFSEVFEKTNVEAGLTACIFHRGAMEAVKEHMRERGIEAR